MSDDRFDERLDRWLAEAGFVAEADDREAGVTDADDPWAEVDLGEIGLTAAQRDALGTSPPADS